MNSSSYNNNDDDDLVERVCYTVARDDCCAARMAMACFKADDKLALEQLAVRKMCCSSCELCGRRFGSGCRHVWIKCLNSALHRLGSANRGMPCVDSRYTAYRHSTSNAMQQ